MADSKDTAYDGLGLMLRGSHPLKGLCGEWLSLLKQAKEVKHQLFGQFANEAMNFYDSAHNFMWNQDYAAGNQGFLSQEGYGATGLPTFRFTMNKVFEAVALIGPALYHRNPNITVTPFTPPFLSPEDLGLDPQDPAAEAQIQHIVQLQQMDARDDATRAKMKQYLLNRFQQVSNKKGEARLAIDEAVIKGLGLLETRIFTPVGSKLKYPMSTYLSCDDLLQDPDAKYRRDRQWIAIKRVEAVNLVEQKFGLPARTLRGNLQSTQAQNTRLGRVEAGSNKNDARSYDLIEYYEIFSKNGIGQRLKSYAGSSNKSQVDLNQFGEFCYLAIANDVPFPLNIPSNVLDSGSEELFMRAQWPVPFWTEPDGASGWPLAELTFYTNPDHCWPISLIKPGIGELRFLNWCMSFLADKVASNCTSYVATLKAASEEIKQQLVGQTGPTKFLEISTNGAMGADSINKIVQFLQAPDFSRDIWTMLTQVMEIFDKRVGLTELMYGLSSRQLRSAEEASIKNNNTTVRPDEMASRVEDWTSNVALKEMECVAFKMEREDLVPFLGEVGASVFEQKVLAQPMEATVMQFDYRIEEGSARKPNKNNKIEQMNQFGQVALPTLQAFALGGQIDPWNAYATDMCTALDLDPDRYLLREPPQPPGAGDPAAEQEAQRQQMELESQQQLAQAEESQQRFQMDIQSRQAEMDLKSQQFQQDAAIKQAMADQDMQIKLNQAAQDAEAKQQEMSLARLQALSKAKLDAENFELKRRATLSQIGKKSKI